MKRLATTLILINVLACGSESKDSGANLVAAESETTTTTTDETTKETETTETEEEDDTINPDAYPIADGFTKIAVSSFEPVITPVVGWEIKFQVDFQCAGAIEIRAEFVTNAVPNQRTMIQWTTYTVDSQPASWVTGYVFSEAKAFSQQAEYADGYNRQSRVLYKCL